MVSLTEKPMIEATFKYAASTTCEGIRDNECVNGIGYEINFKNDVYVDLFGEKTIPLHEFTAPITGNCIKVGPQTCPSNGSGSGANSTIDDSDSGTDDGSTNGTDEGSNDHTDEDVAIGNGIDNAPEDDSNNDSTDTKAKRGDEPFDFIEDNPAADDAIFESLSAAALADTDIDNQQDSSDTSQIEGVPDSSYVQISDTSNTYSLAAGPEGGNIYISAAGQGTYFASVSGFIVADDSDNYLHYYPDVMAAYNVSRLRLSPETAIPKTADLVGLAPVDTDGIGETASLYAALDTLGNVFTTVVCDIEGQDSKLFLVRDAEQGVAMLKQEKLRWTVTGGIVSDCYFLPWGAGVAPN